MPLSPMQSAFVAQFCAAKHPAHSPAINRLHPNVQTTRGLHDPSAAKLQSTTIAQTTRGLHDPRSDQKSCRALEIHRVASRVAKHSTAAPFACEARVQGFALRFGRQLGTVLFESGSLDSDTQRAICSWIGPMDSDDDLVCCRGRAASTSPLEPSLCVAAGL